MCSIDQRPDRRMQGDADEPAHRQHRANRCLIPIRLRQQEHPHIGPQTAADISEEEVQPIERAEVPHKDLTPQTVARLSKWATERKDMVALLPVTVLACSTPPC